MVIISGWCIVAIVALIIGGICSIKNKNYDYFEEAIFLTMLIGLCHILFWSFINDTAENVKEISITENWRRIILNVLKWK